MWAGRTAGLTDRAADDFNSSIRFDARMYRQDITGSIAHAKMLGAQGIITAEEAEDLERLLTMHAKATGSKKAQEILDHFAQYLPKFKAVISDEYLAYLRKGI